MSPSARSSSPLGTWQSGWIVALFMSIAAICLVLTPSVSTQIDVLPLTTRGDLLTRDASSFVRLGVGATNRVLRSDGTDPSWAQVALGTDVSGQLPIGNGGCGQATQTPCFDALSPLTTQGDVLYHNGTDNVRLAAGTSGQFLKTNGAGANPAWSSAAILFTLAGGDSGGYAQPQNTTWYAATFFGVDPSSADAIGGLPFGYIMPRAGTINRVDISLVVLGTNGVNGENITFTLRKNAASNSSTIATLDTDADQTVGGSTALNFAVAQGDVIALSMVAPVTWSAAPTVMLISATLLLE